jgi:putative toxin-antitoxin system antitoxin component (TIGR02293 family)
MASKVFGSQLDAEQWMRRPAMGLGGRRPIELLETTAGAEIVEDFLGRLEDGVYT